MIRFLGFATLLSWFLLPFFLYFWLSALRPPRLFVLFLIHFHWPLLVSCLLRCSVRIPPPVASSVLSSGLPCRLLNLCDSVSLWSLLRRHLSAGRPTAKQRRNPHHWPVILCRQFARTQSRRARSLVSAHGLTSDKGMKMAFSKFM